MDLRAPERLVDVDVPQARHRALVEQRRLDRRPPAGQTLAEPLRRERAVERPAAEAPAEIVGDLVGLEQMPRAEAAHVAVGDVGTVIQLDNRAPVRILAEPAVGGMAQAAGHAQMNQQHTAGLETDDQVLPAPLERRDALALELGRDRHRLERADEPRIADLDALERPPDDVRLEREADRLDLGELGHQPIVSRTIDVVAAASSANVYAASTSSLARAVASSERPCTCATVSPASTVSPRFFRQSTPTAWSISSSFVRRPAPRRRAAMPTSTAPIPPTKPARGAATSRTTGATGSAASAASPPCAVIQRS